MPEPKTKYSFNGIISYPIANFLAKFLCGKVSANFVTLLGSISSIIIIYLLCFKSCDYKLIFIFSFIRAFLDILDGAIARTCKEESKFGAFLDSFSDFIFAISILIIFSYNTYINSNKLTNFYPILALALTIIYMDKMENLNNCSGSWQDNDLLLKPIIYASFSYISSLC